MKSIGRQKSTHSSTSNDQFVVQGSENPRERPVFAKKSTAKSTTPDPSELRVKSTSRSSQTPLHAGQSRSNERSGPSNSQRAVPFPQASPEVSFHRARTVALKVAPTPNLKRTSRPLSVITPTVQPHIGLPHKSSASNPPFWQTSDEAWNKRRSANEDQGGTDRRNLKAVRRVRGVANRVQTGANKAQTVSLRNLNNARQTFVGRGFRLKSEGDPDSSGSDEPMDEDEPTRTPPPRIVALKQTGFKAARKREWPPRRAASSPSSSSSGSQTEGPSDIDSLYGSDHGDSFAKEREDEEHLSADASEDSDVVCITPPPRPPMTPPPKIEFLAPPLQYIKVQAKSPPPESLHLQPVATPRDLIKANIPLELPLTRMRQTKRLPFLLRNLRRGFLIRCKQVNVQTEPSEDPAHFEVHFEFLTSNNEAQVHIVTVDNWVCPLCDLHGFFKSKDMLINHLSWDHTEVGRSWDELENGRQVLRLLLIDLELNDERPFTPQDLYRQSLAPRTPQTKGTQEPTSPLPFVALSPPTSRLSVARNTALEESPLTPVPDTPVATRVKHLRHDSPTPATSSSRSPLPSSRSRSITAATTATTTTATTASRTTLTTTSSATPAPRLPSRYPTPPPAHNRLGPAAQPPYLPFKSEYGGPDIDYSCRPGGACLYDLLNTLPLEPYGVLAWDILDREDEIFDSDNVKDEYKVMHALWGRWIVLNRNTFVANYYKGTMEFVNFYWKMIHRASGWDGLRYWLLMLSVNRFLSGHEIAQILKHYEGLVGMDFWDS